MERPSPDLAGYRDAQLALIEKLGSDVLFFIPQERTWPEWAAINPETGEPFDPCVAPETDLVGTATIRCGIAIRGKSGTKATDEETAVGRFEDGEGMLLVPIDAFTANEIDQASEAEIYGERYEVVQTDTDGIADDDHRALVYIRQK